MDTSHFPLPHSGHDYDELVSRWEILASGTGLDLQQITSADGFPVLALETRVGADLPDYISAGVHGDECAPVWALLHWAEENRELLETRPFLIFPCLNPHGFAGNRRVDGSETDLNRNFQNASHPVIAAWQRVLGEKKFRRCLNLHEDYDARGIYLYEISQFPGLGRRILDDCGAVIACHPDPDIDGQDFENGLCFHEGAGIHELVADHLEGGYPEAIYLYLHHSSTSLTFETPSEMDLSRRIRAQRRAIDSFVSIGN